MLACGICHGKGGFLGWEHRPVVEVFASGRRIDAELVRGRLEAGGVDAIVWAGGMGVWRVESALTELTGVPNAFNAYRVMVGEEDLGRVNEILESQPIDGDEDVLDDPYEPSWRLARSRWGPFVLSLGLLAVVVLLRGVIQ